MAETTEQKLAEIEVEGRDLADRLKGVSAFLYANGAPDLLFDATEMAIRQVLALSDEVERLGRGVEAAHTVVLEMQQRAEAAEAEARTLREALAEIREIAITRRTFTDRAKYADVLEAALRRIAALATLKNGETE